MTDETVKRYDVMPRMAPSRTGHYVAYADYTALAQRLADVAYLAEWIQRGNDPLLPQHYVAGLVGGRFGAFAGQDLAEVSADSLPALGALLRQREVGR